MRKTLDSYEGVMLKKILTCRKQYEVIAIVDRKIDLIEKKTIDKFIINNFLDTSLFNLRNSKRASTDPCQLSNLRVAISHFQTLKYILKYFRHFIFPKHNYIICH